MSSLVGVNSTGCEMRIVRCININCRCCLCLYLDFGRRRVGGEPGGAASLGGGRRTENGLDYISTWENENVMDEL
jgi:hypothetical protein